MTARPNYAATVLQSFRVEHQDFPATVNLLALIKALAALFAQPAALDHRADERRHGKRGLLPGFRHRGLQLVAYVHVNVDAYQVERTERGAARTTQRRPGNAVYFIRTQAQLLHRVQDIREDVKPDAVADKAGYIMGEDAALAQRLAAEALQCRGHGGIGLLGWDQFEEPQVAGRIEEVRAQKSSPHLWRQYFGYVLYWDAGRVGTSNGVVTHVRRQCRPEALFDCKVFKDCLDHPIALG